MKQEVHNTTRLSIAICVGARALHVFGPTPDQAPEGLTTAFQVDGWSPRPDPRAPAQAGARRRERRESEDEEERGETMGALADLPDPEDDAAGEGAAGVARANRTERQILLRETSPQVMMVLLNNPHVESDDVLAMVRSPYAPGSILKRVAGDRRWSTSPDIRIALVRNPQTPSAVGLQPLRPACRPPRSRVSPAAPRCARTSRRPPSSSTCSAWASRSSHPAPCPTPGRRGPQRDVDRAAPGGAGPPHDTRRWTP